MKEKYIYLALLKIKNNTNITELVHEGLDYEGISNLIKELIRQNLIVELESIVTLSELGINEFNRLSFFYKKTDKAVWITPDEKNKVEQIEKNFIFVPIQSELNF